MTYNAEWVRAHYDAYGMREWDRWDSTPVQGVKFAIHLHYHASYLRSSDRVLDVGAGAGRFTREIARLSQRVTVADISPVQLELNRRQAATYGYAGAVEAWVQCDVCNMSAHFADGQFDVVVCYGGPLSYALDRRTTALQELKRVTRTGGLVLVSVMGLFGSIHQYLTRILELPAELTSRVLRTGDVSEQESELSRHHHHLFRAAELREMISDAGLELVVMSASNALSSGWDDDLKEIAGDPQRWDRLIEMEIEASRQAGFLDGGTHIIAVCRV